jgi:oligoribonuclease (3'-5' exoribonuclease)
MHAIVLAEHTSLLTLVSSFLFYFIYIPSQYHFFFFKGVDVSTSDEMVSLYESKKGTGIV